MGHSLFVVNIGPQRADTNPSQMKQKAEDWLYKQGFCETGKFGEGKADYFTIGGGFGACFEHAAAGEDAWDGGRGPGVRQYMGETGIKDLVEELGSDYACISRRRSDLRKKDWLVAVDYHH